MKYMNFQALYDNPPEIKKSVTPMWAVTDQKVQEWIKEWVPRGFIRNYLDYTLEASGAPRIYHLATALNITSFALSQCEISVKTYAQDDKGNPRAPAKPNSYKLIPVLWGAIVGESGDRKSTAMNFGKRVLRKAIEDTDLANGEAPDQASPEAIQEHMADHQTPIFTFRDELSTLLSNSKRTHLEHMKPLLLQIFDHSALKRRKAKDTSKRTQDNEGNDVVAEAYQVTVAKPIKMILGCIPPRVFAKQTSIDDWDTGLLPRFMYWPGCLDTNINPHATPLYCDEATENRLALNLRSNCINRTAKGRQIIVPPEINYLIVEWDRTQITPLRGHCSAAFYAYLKRSPAVAIKIAACLAVTEQSMKPKTKSTTQIKVSVNHLNGALELLDLMNPKLMALFDHTKRDRLGAREESLLNLLKQSRDGVTIEEILNQLDDAPSRTIIARQLKDFEQSHLVMRKKLPILRAQGTHPYLYFIPEYKLRVLKRINRRQKQADEALKARNKARDEKSLKNKNKAPNTAVFPKTVEDPSNIPGFRPDFNPLPEA